MQNKGHARSRTGNLKILYGLYVLAFIENIGNQRAVVNIRLCYEVLAFAFATIDEGSFQVVDWFLSSIQLIYFRTYRLSINPIVHPIDWLVFSILPGPETAADCAGGRGRETIGG